MSKEVYDKIVLAGKNNKSIMINIIEFTDILKDTATDVYKVTEDFQPVTDMEILKTGLYAKIAGANCFVVAFVAPGCMRVSDLEMPPASTRTLRLKSPLAQEEDNIRQYWSAEISILEYGK